MSKVKNFLFQRGRSMIIISIIFGFILSMQARQVQEVSATVNNQRVEELSMRLLQLEEERNALKNQLLTIEKESSMNQATNEFNEELKIQACLVPLEGPGIIIKLDDSSKQAKAGENPNLYIIHDDDILKIINELRAAGAEAISINGQRLVDTSEIRCAGPTLSVNNIRSSAPYEIHAIGDRKNLENAIKMRGGVAETLKVWGINLEVESTNTVYIPPFKGTRSRIFAHVTSEKN